MEHTALHPAVRRQNAQVAKPAFSVVAIHDGFFANVRAMEALEWLKSALCPDLRVCPACWSFDALERQEVRTTSARAAAAAELLVVSAADEMSLPDHVKQWFSSIPEQQRDTRPVIVALHEEEFESSNPPGLLCSQLKEVADSWQTEFMCNADFDRRMDSDFATQLLSSKSPVHVHRLKPFAGEFPSVPRFWGING